MKLVLVCINKTGMDDYTRTYQRKENKYGLCNRCQNIFFLLGASLRIVPGPRSTNHTEMFFGRLILFQRYVQLVLHLATLHFLKTHFWCILKLLSVTFFNGNNPKIIIKKKKHILPVVQNYLLAIARFKTLSL